ncbi:MAG: hypothetical protein CMO34_01010 [Verrucomicrobia bacterium]|nr:hypothetical protein [Verrucomicrobiota bacterium]|tara:strand:+ start:1405 stop:1590 length:186 start_codon:yes stop_codon:yes gene_type:complete
MKWNDIVYGIGDFLEMTFQVFHALGNVPNIIFTLVIFGGLIYWLRELVKYKAAAKRTGGVE